MGTKDRIGMNSVPFNSFLFQQHIGFLAVVLRSNLSSNHNPVLKEQKIGPEKENELTTTNMNGMTEDARWRKQNKCRE